MSRPNWQRPLPRPLVIPTVITLTTLADVRALIDRHVPAAMRNKATWRYVRKQLDEAARGANTTDVAAALLIALQLEGVTCRPQ